MGWLTQAFGFLFGAGNGKGVVGEVSDAVDKWSPSPTTKHAMATENAALSIADQQAGDASQNSARAMTQVAHDSWFDVAVDGLSRLVRPILTYWVIGGLVGLWPLPTLCNVDPIMMNIVWTVITFWFGSRTVFKDLPAAYVLVRKINR